MKYPGNPEYSLRYDWRGREKEMNNISPRLAARDFRIDEVDEHIRPRFQIMREAIEISRMYRYDMDIFFSYRVLKIAMYKKVSKYHDLTPLMPLFAGADLVSMDSLNFGRAVMLTANYMFARKPNKA